ncbi:MAG TPA: hypothetical protein VK470_01585 [Bacteroidota bacterium]|nr:hypothetical protein [Bacteroidota bacterium]
MTQQGTAHIDSLCSGIRRMWIMCAAALTALYIGMQTPQLHAQPLPRPDVQENGASHKERSQPCDSSAITYDVDDASPIDLSFLLPPLIADQIQLKRYIRDPRFRALRALCSDTTAADAIFLRALEIADGDIRHALLVAMFGTMDHYRLGLRIPLLGVLNIPLTTESDSTFRVRHRNLPGRILPDSAGLRGGDKDKLQHFFGSAFLTYFTNSRSFANLIGNFIETGEESFVVGGANDDRDKYANHLGQEFGLRLLDGEDVVPSDVLWRR